MRNEKALNDAVEAGSNPVYLQTKLDEVEYYKDTYGEKQWRSHMTRDILRSLGLPETKKNLNTYGRDIQAGRENTASKRADIQARYEKLGHSLPPVSRTPKGDSITITVKGTQSNGHGGTRDREFSVTLSGSRAYDFVNNPSFDDIYDEYFDGEYEGQFDDDSSELEVAGVSIS